MGAKVEAYITIKIIEFEYFQEGYKKGIFLFRREAYSKENAFCKKFMAMEIASNLKAVKFTRTHNRFIGSPINSHLNTILGYDISKKSYEGYQSQATAITTP